MMRLEDYSPEIDFNFLERKDNHWCREQTKYLQIKSINFGIYMISCIKKFYNEENNG